MVNETRITREASGPEISYFELQAYVGTTKHLGGLESTKELINLCRIDGNSYVLDVGCGAGATPCHLAKVHGCNVVGVDLRESMISIAKARATGEGLEDRIEFRVADARDLPFEDALFEAVLCESVATFVENKQQVADELVRVTKPGGYVGLNEETWLRTPPPSLAKEAKRMWEIKGDIPTAEDWLEILENAGLRDIVVKTHEFDARREATQVKRYRPIDHWKMFYRTAWLHLTNQGFREYMKERTRLPKDVFKYLGYSLFVGRKQAKSGYN
jgi:arsenite methyltransferase